MNSAPAKSSRALWVMFALVALVAVGQLTRSWHASLLDRYEFRQLQTALSTHWMVEDGWQLAYPTPLFGPPWSIPMEFPTYQVITATVHQITGIPLEQAGRLVSVLMLLACLPALHDLLALAGLAHSRRLIVHALILTAPVYLFYGRTFMIETTGLCLCVWFLALLRRSLAKPTVGWIIITVIFAVMAALTKVTTFVVFGLPAAALCLAAWQRRTADGGQNIRLAVAAIAPALLSLGAAWWWVRFGDAVKDSNPFSGFLTARELQGWNFGSWTLRGDWSFWLHLQETISAHNLTGAAFAVALLCTLFASVRARWSAGIALIGFFSGPLVFANLYHLHDYYYAANALLLLTAAGIIIASVWDEPRLPRGFNWLALAIVLIAQGNAYYRGYASHHRNPAPPPPAMADIIKAHVPENGVVLIYGADWNPLLPYYMQRRTVMVPGERENEFAVLEAVIDRLQTKPGAVTPFAAMVVHGAKLRQDQRFIQSRAARFQLNPVPAASDTDFDLYLPGTGATAPAVDDELAETALPGDTKDLFTPPPMTVRSRYGLSAATLDGRAILNAHAPSELIFEVPSTAGELIAMAGLQDAAVAPGQPVISDGITVDILQEFADGTRRPLSSRFLDPARNADDRGPQPIHVALPRPFAGRLILRLGNGPAGNPANDWAYWASVEIR
ncbi:MAG: glycosyltransferase family 39 protein [Opitutaceae bacterium]|nr:glycosyltransferase family 39 protein [Opitutaceae bacterium]